jgi:hypothetical protein
VPLRQPCAFAFSLNLQYRHLKIAQEHQNIFDGSKALFFQANISSINLANISATIWVNISDFSLPDISTYKLCRHQLLFIIAKISA